MTYHISLFDNQSPRSILTANPVADRDTYFILPESNRNPEHNVEVNRGNWSSYDEAFPSANFIYTGRQAYCFWDSGKSQIFLCDQEGNKKVWDKSAGDLTLTIDENGSIEFTRN